MARINDRLLVQGVDQGIVLVDESTGNEVVVNYDEIISVITAANYFLKEGMDL